MRPASHTQEFRAVNDVFLRGSVTGRGCLPQRKRYKSRGSSSEEALQDGRLPQRKRYRSRGSSSEEALQDGRLPQRKRYNGRVPQRKRYKMGELQGGEG